jgi:ATP-dependent DNA helicase PIF1
VTSSLTLAQQCCLSVHPSPIHGNGLFAEQDFERGALVYESSEYTITPHAIYASIHKAQGLTMDAAYLDIRAAREPGQAYVAVSRVRTLAGLNFKDWFSGVWVSEQAIRFYERN